MVILQGAEIIVNPITLHYLMLWDWLKVPFQLQSPHNPLLSFLRPFLLSSLCSHLFVLPLVCAWHHMLVSHGYSLFFLVVYLLARAIWVSFKCCHFFSAYVKGQSDLLLQTFFEQICYSDPRAPGLKNQTLCILVLSFYLHTHFVCTSLGLRPWYPAGIQWLGRNMALYHVIHSEHFSLTGSL